MQRHVTSTKYVRSDMTGYNDLARYYANDSNSIPFISCCTLMQPMWIKGGYFRPYSDRDAQEGFYF